MKLHSIAKVTLILLPFHVCFGMENKLAGLRPAPKKYHRRPATQEFLVSVDYYINQYNELSKDGFISELPKEGFISIEENFKKAFGYPVPTNSDDYQKTTFKNFVKNHALFNAIEHSAPQQSPQYAFETLVKEINLFLEQKERKEKQILARQNAARAKLRHEIERVKKHLAVQLKEQEEREIQEILAKQNAITENLQQKIETTKQRLREIDKNNQKQKNPQQIKQLTQKPQSNRIQQIATIKHLLRKEYKCQTDAQVKNYLLKKCKRLDTCCIWQTITSKNAMVHYKRNTNELTILIGDEIDSYEFDHAGHESDDESSD